MDLDATRSSPVGELIPISGPDNRTGESYEYFAYLATPLPAAIELQSATWTSVTQAEASLARLDQSARQIPEPALLRRPALRREAQSTSALEGTFAPLEDVLGSDVEDRAQLSLEVREILNYVAAAEHAFAWVEERPLTSSLIADLQGLLVQGTAGEHSDAGRLRDRHVFIGPRDAPIEAARFVPAPFGDQLRNAFESWIRWVNDGPTTLPPVVRAGMAHYQFETLHPFSDGNGRIGRLLIVLHLMRAQILRDPILVVSPWFEERREQYQDALLTMSMNGDWDAWISFFVTGVGAAAQATHRRIEAPLAWQETTVERVREAGVTGVAERVAGELIGAPVLRAGQVSEQHRISHQGAMNALRRLAEMEVLVENRRPGGVIFTAPRVVELLST